MLHRPLADGASMRHLHDVRRPEQALRVPAERAGGQDGISEQDTFLQQGDCHHRQCVFTMVPHHVLLPTALDDD